MLNKDNALLVVVDVQGKLYTLMHNHDDLHQNLKIVIEGAKALELPIVLTEQLPDKLGPTNPEIKELLLDHEPFVKDTFSCCGDDKFVAKLEELGRKQVILTGIETHVCVYQTAMDLIAAGYDVYLVTDAASSRIESNYHLGVQRISEAGATLTSVEMSLFEMLKVAKGDQFKAIVKLLK